MTAEVRRLVDGFGGLRTLVVGDVVLDAFLDTQPSGLAREAPVPALRLGSRHHHPGGAGNTARNLAALGAQVSLVAAVGGDDEAALLVASLAAGGVDTDALVVEETRATAVLNRVRVDSQVLLRLDEGDVGPVSPATEEALLAAMARGWADADAVIVSDYGRGTISALLRQHIARLQHDDPRLLVVDARQVSAYRDAKPTVVKPNWVEATTMLAGAAATTPGAIWADRAAGIVARAEQLHELTGARIVAVTLDCDGAVVLEQGYPPYRTFARPVAARSSIGAGDSFAAALTLGLAAGAAVPMAAELAARAADVVTARDRTAVCSAGDLLGTDRSADKIGDRAALAAHLEQERAAGRRIVFTNGCFDILHLGHVNLLNRAKSMGDVLVVGVNSDSSVARLKGPTRPINSAGDRMGVLSALSCVDHILCFDEDTAESCLRALLPQVYVKGGDYSEHTVPEASLADRLGIELRILPLVEARSTSAVIERIQSTTGAS